MQKLAEDLSQALKNLRTRIVDEEVKHQYYEMLLNKVDTAVLVTDRSNRMEWMNKAARELLGHCPHLPEEISTAIQENQQVAHLQKGNATFDLSLSVTHIQLQGRTCRLISLKNIHGALEYKEMEAWQKLIRVLTHEIMNSITPIISLTELLSRQIEELKGDEGTKSEIRQMLQTISRRGNGLVHFVGNYREVSHLPQPLLKPHTAQDILQDTLQLMQSERNDLQLSLPRNSLCIIADKAQIEQILINLIKNARENEAEHIVLSSGITSTDHPYLRVADDGTGIEPDVLERIFIPFFTTKPSGSGIGLTISRQIMHQHNGNITVSSHLGEGSTFTLLFPSI